MCRGVLSSSIRQNRDGLPPLPMIYDQQFIDQLTEFIPHLTSTTFSGGESFMIKIYYDIWEKRVTLNPASKINIITNGSVMNSRIKDLLHKGNFIITMSIDAFDKQLYESIRKNAHYETLMQNLQYFADIRATTKTQLTINFCPMPPNMYHIPTFVQKCNELNCNYYFSIVYLPNVHSLQSLPANELEKLVQFLIANEPQNYPNQTNRDRYHAFIANVQGWKNNATQLAIEPGLNIHQFLEQFNQLSQQAIEQSTNPIPLLQSKDRVNQFVEALNEALDYQALSKSILEKDNIKRVLEETAKCTDTQAKEGLLYFFGKPQK